MHPDLSPQAAGSRVLNFIACGAKPVSLGPLGDLLLRNVLTFEQASRLAATWVATVTQDQCLITTSDQKPYGWVFFYSAPGDMPVAGNAPIIVNRFTGEIRVTGTAGPLEEYLAAYETAMNRSPN